MEEQEQSEQLGQDEGEETQGSEFAQPAESPTAPGGEDEPSGLDSDEDSDAGDTGEEE
jgi:hypothetical protein